MDTQMSVFIINYFLLVKLYVFLYFGLPTKKM